MKIKFSQLRRIIRESLEEDLLQVDPIDQKLYDTFLVSGVMALSLAESGLGSPELVSKMKTVVDHVSRLGGAWDPKDKERTIQDPDFDEWSENRVVELGGGSSSASTDRSAGRAALSEVGKFMKDHLTWDSMPWGTSDLQDLANTLMLAELAWMYPYTLKYAKHREPKLKEMFEWAGV
jgi:hypothetical protein